MEIKEAIKIIKGLIRIAELGYNSNPLSKEGEHTTTEALTLAIAAIEKQEKDGWIPVTERLPEFFEEVLVVLDDFESVTVGKITPTGIWLVDFDDKEHDDVVAWMPLPEQYQEDKT